MLFYCSFQTPHFLRWELKPNIQNLKFKILNVSQLQMEKKQELIWGTFYSPTNGSTEVDTTVMPVNWNLRSRFCSSAPEARVYRHLKQLQWHASCSSVGLLHTQMAGKILHHQLPSHIAALGDKVEGMCRCLCIQHHQQRPSLQKKESGS